MEQSGFVFIGPRPETIRLMGDKVEAIRAMKAAGVTDAVATSVAVRDAALAEAGEGTQRSELAHQGAVAGTVAAAPSRHDQDKSAPAEPREILTGAQMYELARSRQLDYGPFFQVVDRVDLIDDDRARVHFAASKLTYDGMLCDPTLIDGGLQGVLCLLALRDASG